MKQAFLILIAGLLVLSACTTETVNEQQDTTPDSVNEQQDTTPDITDTQTVDNEESSDEVITFVVEGHNYYFMIDGERNPDIVVNEGDTVRIEFSSVDGFHDWVLDEFNAATQQVSTGGTTTVEFVADQAGTFEYYCSVGSHRAQGMLGNIIVQ